MIGAEFDEEHSLWQIETDPGGRVTARFVINAGGVLTDAEAARHRRCRRVRGRHHAHRAVGSQRRPDRQACRIIGTGASAVQIIPEIASIVDHLTVFQRTPIWCLPKGDVPLPPPRAGRCAFPAERPYSG